MNTERTLRELVFKLVARKIGSGDAKSLAYKVMLLTAEINRLYGVQVGGGTGAVFFPATGGTLFQYNNVVVGVFDQDGAFVGDGGTFIGDLEDIHRKESLE